MVQNNHNLIGNGGNFLKMWTTNTDFDMSYNREF